MISLQDKLEEAQARESRLVTRMEAIDEKAQVRESKLVGRLEAMEKKMAGMAKSGLDIGKGSENDEVKGAKEKFPKKGKELSSKSKGILAMVEDSMSEVSESDEEEKGKNITGNKKTAQKGRSVRKEELKKNESASSSSSSEGLSEVEERGQNNVPEGGSPHRKV
ncbi:protein SREK1IP1-like [Macrobrachium rosenbergii]|uniref:protein SREK1IP1-like n=1 Tax=Macrobrachium rosenbergii TaxID=79674 RepID=UPI0034D6A740